ncbi:MAG: hypothetical protein M1825_003168 [Sarcosagium campestre]|nr:MAG: hypothetical protein M1825_003168 [Sarcosagium campestre]
MIVRPTRRLKVPYQVIALTQSMTSTPTGIFLSTFLIFYLLLVCHVRRVSYRDPGSFFFDHRVAYEKQYSLTRERQASAFIDSVSTENVTSVPSVLPSSSSIAPSEQPDPTLCLGIASIARDGARYFRQSVGSVLEGLTTAERRSIDLVLFIAHSDPTVHPASSEPWLQNLSARLPSYAALPLHLRAHIAGLEREQIFAEKALFDYVLLLKTCLAGGAPYIAVLEDDILAARGWYKRTLSALLAISSLNNSSSSSSSSSSLSSSSASSTSTMTKMTTTMTTMLGTTKRQRPKNWLYLRLFHTEEFLGWNREHWPIYLVFSLCAMILAAVVPFAARTILLLRQTRRTKITSIITNSCILASSLICAPLCIILVFLVGHTTLFPLPAGVVPMPRFGCCSQGLVFPRDAVPGLVNFLEGQRAGQVDVLVEQWAERAGLERYAVVPSVLQHVGRKSSKGDDFGEAARYGMSVAQKLWSFGFETLGPDGLL